MTLNIGNIRKSLFIKYNLQQYHEDVIFTMFIVQRKEEEIEIKKEPKKQFIKPKPTLKIDTDTYIQEYFCDL